MSDTRIQGYREAAMDFRRMMLTGFTVSEMWTEVFKHAILATSSLDLKPVPTKASMKGERDE